MVKSSLYLNILWMILVVSILSLPLVNFLQVLAQDSSVLEETATSQAFENVNKPSQSGQNLLASSNSNRQIINNLQINQVYTYTQNPQVSVKFHLLDRSVSQPELSFDQEEIEIDGRKTLAYKIESNMTNGNFQYDLTLPNPNKNSANQVKYSENGVDFVEITNQSSNFDRIYVPNLDHFTIFVVVQTPLPQPATSQGIYINEVDFRTTGGEWVEIYNSTNSEVDLNGWKIDLHLTATPITQIISINHELKLAPKSFVVVGRGDFNWNNNYLDNSGDVIILKNSTNEIVDQIEYDSVVNLGGPALPDFVSGETIAREIDGGLVLVKRSGSEVTKAYSNNLLPALSTPVNLGFNTRSLSTNPNELAVDLPCGSFTNGDFPLFSNTKLAQNWELANPPSGVKYQRSWQQPNSSVWTEESTIYTNTDFIDFSIDGLWNTRVMAWLDLNGNNIYDVGIDLASNWSNECGVTVDTINPTSSILEWGWDTPADNYISGSGSGLSRHIQCGGSINDTGDYRALWQASDDPNFFYYEGEFYHNENYLGPFIETRNYTNSAKATLGEHEGLVLARIRVVDKAGNKSISDVDWANKTPDSSWCKLTIDLGAPQKPTDLKWTSLDQSQFYSCGDEILSQNLVADWDDNLEADFDHYEYVLFNSDGSILQEIVDLRDSKMVVNLPDTKNIFGYAVRSVDIIGNKSEWSLGGKNLLGSCQIVPPASTAVLSKITVCAEDDLGNPLKDWQVNLSRQGGIIKESQFQTGVDVVNNLGYFESGVYEISVSGTYNYGQGVADAGYSYHPTNLINSNPICTNDLSDSSCWVNGDILPDEQNLEIQINQQNINWGKYQPNHEYSTFYHHNGGEIKFNIADNSYLDNTSGNLQIIIKEVSDSQKTDITGCTSFENILLGEYNLTETVSNGWQIKKYPTTDGKILVESDLNLIFVNKQIIKPTIQMQDVIINEVIDPLPTASKFIVNLTGGEAVCFYESSTPKDNIAEDGDEKYNYQCSVTNEDDDSAVANATLLIKNNPPVIDQITNLDSTFRADVSGGNKPYTYFWQGDCTGYTQLIDKPITHGNATCTLIVKDIDGDSALATFHFTNNNPSSPVLENSNKSQEKVEDNATFIKDQKQEDPKTKKLEKGEEKPTKNINPSASVLGVHELKTQDAQCDNNFPYWLVGLSSTSLFLSFGYIFVHKRRNAII